MLTILASLKPFNQILWLSCSRRYLYPSNKRHFNLFYSLCYHNLLYFVTLLCASFNIGLLKPLSIMKFTVAFLGEDVDNLRQLHYSKICLSLRSRAMINQRLTQAWKLNEGQLTASLVFFMWLITLFCAAHRALLTQVWSKFFWNNLFLVLTNPNSHEILFSLYIFISDSKRSIKKKLTYYPKKNIFTYSLQSIFL